MTTGVPVRSRGSDYVRLAEERRAALQTRSGTRRAGKAKCVASGKIGLFDALLARVVSDDVPNDQA